MKKRGFLIIVSGPSGAGKGTVCESLLKEKKDIYYSISATTRKPRKGEFDGENYYFLAEKVFKEMIDKGELLEWAEIYGNYYGTPSKKILSCLEHGQDVLLEIDAQGAKNIVSKIPEALLIYILPPSFQELEHRIKNRATDTEEVINHRLSMARKEIAKAFLYDYVIVNETIEDTVKSIQAILRAERLSVEQNKELIQSLIED